MGPSQASTNRQRSTCGPSNQIRKSSSSAISKLKASTSARRAYSNSAVVVAVRRSNSPNVRVSGRKAYATPAAERSGESNTKASGSSSCPSMVVMNSPSSKTSAPDSQKELSKRTNWLRTRRSQPNGGRGRRGAVGTGRQGSSASNRRATSS